MARSNDIKKVVTDTRRWVEQEKTWGGEFFATQAAEEKRLARDGGLAVTAGKPQRQREEVLLTDTPRRPYGQPAATAPRSSGKPPFPEKATALNALFEKYKTCTRCPLGFSRLNFVFGVGNPGAEVMFIGEGPGYQEDHKGEPFVGRSGQLLDKMMEAIGLSRKTIYIANIVKCHPMVNPKTPEEHGNDRPPTPEESGTCSPILQQQIEIIKPRILVTLGSPSTKSILNIQDGISKVRGRLFSLPQTFFKAQSTDSDLFGAKKADDFEGFTPEQIDALSGIQVLPTYHPAALLRNPNLKKDAWEDLKLLRDTLQNPA